MATQATAIWRMRTGGNAANGAGFDAGISGSGTDYSQQDTAQLSLTDIACSNNTTVTSATGGWTAAMVGNAMKIPTTGGATAGYYWITARASSTSITVDRTPGTVSGGSGKVGGACTGDPLANLGPYVVPGNTVFLRATAGNAASFPTTSLDYAIAGFATPTPGDEANGLVRWVGENGVPTIGSPGLGFYQCAFQSWEGLYFAATSNGTGTFGVLNMNTSRVLGCTINLNLQATLLGIFAQSSEILGTEVYGGGTSPTSSSGSYGISLGSYNNVVRSCKVHHCRDHGIFTPLDGNTVVDCQIYGNAGNGVEAESTATAIFSSIAGNTIVANGGHGVNLQSTAAASIYEVINNMITDHAGSGKAGINCADGTTAVNDRRKRMIDYNNVHGNTSNYANVSAGAHDLSVDPSYNNAGAFDYTPTNAAVKAGA